MTKYYYRHWYKFLNFTISHTVINFISKISLINFIIVLSLSSSIATVSRDLAFSCYEINNNDTEIAIGETDNNSIKTFFPYLR